jgi:hypothetical protein
MLSFSFDSFGDDRNAVTEDILTPSISGALAEANAPSQTPFDHSPE